MKVSKTTSKQAQAQQLIYDIFTNNGVVGVETEDRDQLNLQCSFKDVFNIGNAMETEGLGEFKDVFYTEDLTRYIGTTVTRLVEESIEPDLLVVPNLFQEISYEGPGRTVEIGSIGAIHAEEVPEGQEYPEPDFDEIIGEQPIYPIKPDNMSKEEVLVFEEKLKEHRVAEDAWWERRVEEQEKYEGKTLLFATPICLLFMFFAFRYKEFPPPIRLGLFGGPVLTLLLKLIPYLGSVWAGARFLIAFAVFAILVIAGTPSLRKKIKSILKMK